MQGIVTCAGGIRYLTCGWVLVNLLRALGCRLPIEVWYSGVSEEDCAWRELVRQLGVTLVDAQIVAVDHPHQRLAGWALKPYAILHSRFDEVLFLDADNVPVVDPTYLFDEPEYHRTGTVFWPDGLKTPPESPRWKIFGVEYRDEPEQESGQVLVNKGRCEEALRLCNWYNERADFYYQHVYGDKDTFRFAWHRTKTPFAMPSKGLEMLPFTICQHDFQGRRLFQHRAHEKWSLAGNRRVPGFVHEEECVGYIEELKRLWRPIPFLAGELSDNDSVRLTALEGSRFELVKIGYSAWPIRLGANGWVTDGYTREVIFWWVKIGDIVLADSEGKQTAILTGRGEGLWEGPSVSDAAVVFQLRYIG